MYFSSLTARSAQQTFFRSALAASLLFVSLSYGLSTGQAKAKIGSLPKEAIAKYPLRTLDGREYTLAGLRGQVVVLEFIAVWCVHSRDQVPTLNKFDDEDRERGLKVLGLMLQDKETSMQRVQQFIKDQKIEFPLSMLSYEMFEKFIDSKDTGVPQTLVYGRNGKLAGYFIGHDDQIAAQLTNVIKQELDKKL